MEEDFDADISRLSLMQASIMVFSQFAKSVQKLLKVSSGNAPKNLFPHHVLDTFRKNMDLRVSRTDLGLR